MGAGTAVRIEILSLRIAFYTGRCLPIHAYSLDERPLGGIETGVIHLAAHLQKRGHHITVFTSHKNPPPSKPAYLPLTDIHTRGEFDVLVAVKDWWPAFFTVPRKKLFYLTGDSFDQYITFGLGDKRVVEKVDYFLAKSDWHRMTLCEMSGFPFEQSFVLGNGLDLLDFYGKEKRERKRLMYSSAPFRGLALTPTLFSRILKLHSDAEFHIFSGLQVYDTDRPFEGPETKFFESLCGILRKIPNVFLHGNIRQKELAREFMKSSILFYPNSFPETNCRTVLEAQAAGCVPVTSALGALPETVGDAGFLIQGNPDSDQYANDFVKHVDLLLQDDVLWQRLSENGLRRAESEFRWEYVANRFETLLTQCGLRE